VKWKNFAQGILSPNLLCFCITAFTSSEFKEFYFFLVGNRQRHGKDLSTNKNRNSLKMLDEVLLALLIRHHAHFCLKSTLVLIVNQDGRVITHDEEHLWVLVLVGIFTNRGTVRERVICYSALNY
jgi:hypothetical protein